MEIEKKDIKLLQKEIESLKSDLKKINEDKEQWFTKKESLKGEIAQLITKVKSLKKVSDVSSEEAKKLKAERDRYNKDVKDLIEKLGKLQNEKIDVIEKFKIKYAPEIIKKNIEKLEDKIETEALSIDEERRLMNRIKRLKKYYSELGGIKSISDKIADISQQIDVTKNKADDAHVKFKEAIDESKSGLKEFFNLSKQINIVKKQQERAFEMFIALKNNFFNVSKQLQQKLSMAKRTKEENRQKTKEEEREKKEVEEKLLEEKTKRVEEKIKRGEKLTTEDLLALQGKKDEDISL